MSKNIAEAYSRTPWPLTIAYYRHQAEYQPAKVFLAMCNCYKEGKTTPPPFDEASTLR